MSNGELVAVVIGGAGLALIVALQLRRRREVRNNADHVHLTAIHAKCHEIISSLDRYSHGASVTTIRVSRTIADQFKDALLAAQSINNGPMRKQAVAVLDFRPASEGPDWVDIYDPKNLQRTVSELANELNRHIDPERRPHNVAKHRAPGRMRKLRNKLFGFGGGERWT